MLELNYKSWESFLFKGKKWLSLIKKDGSRVQIYDGELHSYGAYHSRESFQEFYAREGEALRLS
jgi:hypothetical protein